MDDDHADPEHAGQLHHVELNASDLDAATAFWSWSLDELGYEPKNGGPGGACGSTDRRTSCSCRPTTPVARSTGARPA